MERSRRRHCNEEPRAPFMSGCRPNLILKPRKLSGLNNCGSDLR